jgi:hypothetical protein
LCLGGSGGRGRHVVGIGEADLGQDGTCRRFGAVQHTAVGGGPAIAVDLALPGNVIEKFGHRGVLLSFA